MNIQSQIIKTREEYSINNVKTKDFLIISMITLLNLTFLAYAFFNQDSDWNKAGTVVFILALINLMLYSREINSNISFKEVFYYYLHYIYPDKKDRDSEIREFMRVNIGNFPILFTTDDYEFLDLPIFKEMNVNTLPNWIKANINDTKNVLKLVLSRCSVKGELKPQLLFWSQMIPTIKNLDNLRLLLLSSKLSKTEEISKLKALNKIEIDTAFINYKEEELIYLFTNSMDIKEYVAVLNFYFKYRKSLAVYSDMRELYLWSQRIESSITGSTFSFPKGILQEGLTELGQLKNISNVIELEEAGVLMANCINSLKEKIIIGDKHIYILYLENKPYIIFAINKKGKLLEAKHKANGLLNPSTAVSLQGVISMSLLVAKNN